MSFSEKVWTTLGFNKRDEILEENNISVIDGDFEWEEIPKQLRIKLTRIIKRDFE